MAMVTAILTVTTYLPDGDTPTVEEQEFEFDDSKSITGSCELVFTSLSEGGPTMRPKKPRF